MKNILSDAAQRQKTLKWLASAAYIGGASFIALGIGLLLYGVVKKDDLYDQFTKELNQKYGFETKYGSIVDPEDYKYVDGSEVRRPIETTFKELYNNGFIQPSGGGSWSPDTSYGGTTYREATYNWNWDKVMTSDQVERLSDYTKQFLLNAAVTSGIGGLSLLAGFMLNKSAEKNTAYLSGITSLCKSVLEQFGINIKMMQTEGDLIKALSKDYSRLEVG